ncbi:Smr/MutS family protein [Pelagibius sp. 7325]|uniref:Smr/MutS family protein n=1 Tax=Pelagibius sp. 7325 TaxID=3131994 RepID=UPI0030EBAB0B
MTGRRKTPRPNRQGGLSAEDRRLWQHVAQQAKPLTGRDRLHSKMVELLQQEMAADAQAQKTGSPAPKRRAAKAALPRPTPVGPPAPQPAPLSHGSRDGLDRRNAERLSRGKLPIEATLDLHGLRQAEAHRRLEAFLADCQGAGKRCVLVVTGKGLHKEEGGVLRSAVPRWLNEMPNRPRVLSFDYAQQKHGGTGALYVLLRRRR